MKILVGIMHCIENEFEQCLSAIEQQTHPVYDQFVLSNLPNKEAHDCLYKTFMERADEVDLFVKIDADMVLSRTTFFEELVERFKQDSDLQHIQIALDDWYTNRQIMGLHAYRSNHKWLQHNEQYFVDMVDAQKKTVHDKKELAPAAIHSPDPSPFQAFHFGVHKAVKVLQRDRPEKNLRYSCTHWGHFSHLESHYLQIKDIRLGLAVAGFCHAIHHLYGPSHVNYSCEETKYAFDSYQSLSGDDLDKKVRALGLFALPFLPQSLRFELAAQHNSGNNNILDSGRVLSRWTLNRYNRYRLV